MVTGAGPSLLVAVGFRAVAGEPALAPLEVRLGVGNHAVLSAFAAIPVQIRKRASLLTVGLAHHRPVRRQAVGLREGGAAV